MDVAASVRREAAGGITRTQGPDVHSLSITELRNN